MFIKEVIATPATKSIFPKMADQKEAQSFSQSLQKALGTKGNAYDPLFRAAGEKWGVPPALIKAVAQVESNLDPKAVSRAGAQGLMQLVPATAHSLGVKNPFDPQENIFGGARYLRSLLDRFDGDVLLALAAYNAGPGAVEKYGGVPPFQETQNYLRRVLAAARNTASLNEQLAAQEVPLAHLPAGDPLPRDAGIEVKSEQPEPDKGSPAWLKVWAALLMVEAALAAGDSSDV